MTSSRVPGMIRDEADNELIDDVECRNGGVQVEASLSCSQVDFIQMYTKGGVVYGVCMDGGQMMRDTVIRLWAAICFSRHFDVAAGSAAIRISLSRLDFRHSRRPFRCIDGPNRAPPWTDARALGTR